MNDVFTTNLREHVSRCTACGMGIGALQRGFCREGVTWLHRALDRGVAWSAVDEAIALGRTEFMLHKVIV